MLLLQHLVHSQKSQARLILNGGTWCRSRLITRPLCAAKPDLPANGLNPSLKSSGILEKISEQLINRARSSDRREQKENANKESFEFDFGSDSQNTINLKRVLALARPEWKRINLAIGALLVSVCADMAFPAVMGQMVDLINKPEAAVMSLSTAIGVLSGVFAVQSLANYAKVSLLTQASEKIMMDLRAKLFAALLRQDMSFFDKTKTGELVNRLSTDTTVIAKNLTDNAAQGFRAVLQGIGGVAVLMYLSPKLASLMILLVPPVGIVGVYYGRYVKKLTQSVQSELAKSTEISNERLGNISTVKSFVQQDREMNFYSETVKRVYQLGVQVGKANAAFYSGIHLAANLSLLGVLGYGASLVTSSQISIGTLTSFLFYSLYVLFASTQITRFYADLMKSVGASVRVFQLLDFEPEIRSGTGKLENFEGNITFKNVTFSYPTRREALILNDLTFEVPSGKVMAVVGPSGSGKSTIAALLERFYEAQKGSILLDGIDVKELDVDWMREQIGFVSQDIVLFSGTILENIAYGSHKATFDQIQEAAKQANAHNFISGFPEGYNTSVGERGVTLSAGQIQRIGIARALLLNPKVLILDEATSALDAESEHLVKQALDRLMKNRTVIVIAHRLSTIRNADKIVVLTKGSILEEGNFEELTKKDTKFREFVELQNMNL
eukprot:TRINITY_DN5604_c0_g1_i2.p2 TRINITY_DN5604_c0_g1~~TRINITY_DN5604_c0_g1_i2.p2  ORF type:complete len:670 (+),score=170.68 TRINITY_DN5604_c0_g1_i2:42-2051(+)